MAFDEKVRSGADESAAVALRSLGYMTVDDYRLVDFQPASPEAWDSNSEDEDLDEGAGTRAAVLQAVEDQLRNDDPPETRRTLRRLVGMGHEEDEAKKLIAAVLSVEIFGILEHHKEFDEQCYVEALRQLPELPEALRESDP